MEAACDFCGEGRATVYCRADSARLCLSCDRQVHNANALSQRHLRTLLCDGCNTRPAAVRCESCQSSLCQTCDYKTHNSNSVNAQHKRHNLECFTGCPSADELATLWACDINEVRGPKDGALVSSSLGGSNNQWGGIAQMSAGPGTRESWTSGAQRMEASLGGGSATGYPSMSGVGPPLLAKVPMRHL